MPPLSSNLRLKTAPSTQKTEDEEPSKSNRSGVEHQTPPLPTGHQLQGQRGKNFKGKTQMSTASLGPAEPILQGSFCHFTREASEMLHTQKLQPLNNLTQMRTSHEWWSDLCISLGPKSTPDDPQRTLFTLQGQGIPTGGTRFCEEQNSETTRSCQKSLSSRNKCFQG